MLLVAVVAGLLLGAAPHVGASGTGGPVQTAQFQPSASANASDESVSVARGDVVEVTIPLGEFEGDELVFGPTNESESDLIRLNDTDADGVVRVRVNTYAAGVGAPDGGGYSAAGADTVTTSFNAGSGSALPTGAYLFVHPETERQVGPDVRVVPSRVTGVTKLRGPGSAFDNYQTADEMGNAVRRGEYASMDDDDAWTDSTLYRIEGTGLFGPLRSADGDSPEERLVAASTDDSDGDEPIFFEATASGHWEGDHGLNLSESVDNGAINVVPDSERGVLYLEVDHTDLEVDTYRDMEFDYLYGWHLFVDTAYGTGDGVDVISSLDNPQVTFPDRGDTAVVRPAPEQTVTGRTNVAPGTRVTTVIDPGLGGDHQTRSTTVGRNGTVTVTGNFSAAAPGERWEIRMAGDADWEAADGGEPTFEVAVRDRTPTPAATTSPSPTPDATATESEAATATQTNSGTPTTATAVRQTDGSSTPRPVADTDDSTGRATTAADGNGFGVLSVAVAVAALLLRRRFV